MKGEVRRECEGEGRERLGMGETKPGGVGGDLGEERGEEVEGKEGEELE